MVLLVGIASIKPQLSLVPALALILGYSHPRQWLSGLVIASVECLAIGFVFGFSLYRDFVGALALYSTSKYNHAEVVSGVMNLAARIGVTLSPLFLLATSVGVGALVAGSYRLLRWPSESPDERRRSSVLLTLVIWILNEALVPLHEYDHSIVMIPLALSILFRTFISGLLVPGLVLAGRPSILIRMVGHSVSENGVVTAALSFSCVVGIVALLRPKSMLVRECWFRRICPQAFQRVCPQALRTMCPLLESQGLDKRFLTRTDDR
jgi:hypothetical protein